ncbi:calcium-binding EF-hand family protein [Citrus sinensis]|uniref:Calcium-binding EF-hand family protein n=1 Tax=Citrus sinensis TaxID=2711 RepID=A0ACB8IIK9_CITSI|nr:calcium-binding EF-hand family protein [Citrus sinensis]
MSLKCLKELQKQGVLGTSQISELDFCEDCVLGKATRNSFGKSVHSTKGILEYIHSDLWGLTQTISLGGNTYFLSLIDNYSRRVWAYVVKHKDQVFGKFREWKSLVENQTRLKVKKLRTDNGLEFCNQEFDNYCADHGIARHRIVRLTPQQNSPSTALDFKTPFEKWHVKLANYGSLQVFGCLAYAHVSQGKLAPRALKCKFIGYPEGVKGFKLWCTYLNPRKCIISRDVIFNENTALEMKRSADTDAQKDKNKTKVQFEVEPHNREASGDEDNADHENDQAKVKDRLTATEPKRFKVRLVAKGYTQRAEVDFKEVFSPVVKHASIRVLLALTAVKDMELDQLDVKTAFLHGRLHDDILMTQPEGYTSPESADCVYLLKRSLYRLKQSPRQWMSSSKSVVTPLASHFNLSCSQCPSTDEERSEMIKVPYASVVGCMMYAMVLTRLDLTHALSVHVVTLSTTKAEYTAATEAVKEALWLRGLITELGMKQEIVEVHCDSSSAIYLTDSGNRRVVCVRAISLKNIARRLIETAESTSSMKQQQHQQQVLDGSNIMKLVGNEEVFSSFVDHKFEELDRDRDGQLSVKELQPVVADIGAALGLPAQGSSPDSDHIYSEVLNEFTHGKQEKVCKIEFREVLSDILLGMAAGLKRDPIVVLRMDGEDLEEFINGPGYEPDMASIFSQIESPDGSMWDFIIKALDKLTVEQGMPPSSDSWVIDLSHLKCRLLQILGIIMEKLTELHLKIQTRTAALEIVPKDRNGKLSKDYLRVALDGVAASALLPRIGAVAQDFGLPVQD